MKKHNRYVAISYNTAEAQTRLHNPRPKPAKHQAIVQMSGSRESNGEREIDRTQLYKANVDSAGEHDEHILT